MTHRNRWLAVAVLGIAAAGVAAASIGGGGDAAAGRLAARMLGPTPATDDLRYLCDRIGGRPTGSAANERAVDWFVTRFQDAGVPQVSAEKFPMPRRWEDGASRAALVAPESVPLRVAAMPGSPPTPKGGLTAPVVFVGEGEAADFERAGTALKGAIVLVSSKVIVTLEDLFVDYMRLPPIIARARAAGASALVLIGGRAGGALYRHVASFDASVAPFPMAIVAREEGLRVARLAAEGSPAPRLRLDLAVTEGGPYESRNVVATIPGTDLKDEIVVAGAHIDSWELGTGALDNGANCVMLLDVARQMIALGERPRRSVRIVLWNGEEQGMFGSLGYVRAHRDEMVRTAFMATVDIGTGRITGFSLGGRTDLRVIVETALRPVVGYSLDGQTTDAFPGTDNYDFLLEGVPNLVANQAPANYMEHYHAATDTFDKADLREMRQNGAVIAALLWGLANSAPRIERLDRAGLEALMKRTQLDDQMKSLGLWEDWAAGRRGRAIPQP